MLQLNKFNSQRNVFATNVEEHARPKVPSPPNVIPAAALVRFSCAIETPLLRSKNQFVQNAMVMERSPESNVRPALAKDRLIKKSKNQLKSQRA